MLEQKVKKSGKSFLKFNNKMNYKEYLDKYISIDKILARRCYAAVIDYFIFNSIVLMYGYFFGNVKLWYFENWSFHYNINFDFIDLFWLATFWIIYFPLIESIFGYTLGKGLFDLQVIVEDQLDFALVASFKRHLADIIDFFMFGLIAIILVKFSDEHKRIGDLWARTRVVIDE